MKYNVFVILLAPFAESAWAAIQARCPPPGPVLPQPNLSLDLNLDNVTVQIEALLKSSATSWNASATSFSVELTSADKTIYEYHHTAKVLNETGTDKVDTDTIYRVASITKVFASLALLLEAPWAIDVPARWFIPELAGLGGYEEITLEMLANHMSGIPRDGYAFDWYGEGREQLQQGGFPMPPSDDLPTCDGLGLPSCTRKEFFDILHKHKLSWKVNDRPAYSDLAYILLGFALENITGKSFDEMIRDSITSRLGLSATGIETPDLSKAVIPPGIAGVFMGFDIANFNSAAGLYSTPREITTFVRSILNHTFLTPAQTRGWLKPDVFAGSLSTAVGMPWEIFRLSGLTMDKRPVDVYTKSGDIPGYSAEIMLFPDYGVGATIMVSGEDAYTPTVDLMDTVSATLIPIMDKLAREQANETYSGTYTSGSGNATASLTLQVDDGPGLKIREWTNLNKSILETLGDYKGIPLWELDARIYPIGQDNRWRLQLEHVRDHVGKIPSLPSQLYRPWFQVDQFRYAGYAIDEFTFVVEDGAVKSVCNLGLRAMLRKLGSGAGGIKV